MAKDPWIAADAYESYVGRWSRRVAAEFVRWLDLAPGARWLDIGCGTGALASAVLSRAEPAGIIGVDTSEEFLESARTANPGATFRTGDAMALPFPDRDFDAVVSGLALNFVPDPGRAAAEFVRVLKPGGLVAVYVWDYAGGMELIRHFWDAAKALDPAAPDEADRFPICQPGPLRSLWIDIGLEAVQERAIVVPTTFATFDDLWAPFLGAQGPAPGYVMSLDEDRRSALRDLLRARLTAGRDVPVELTARAWAVRGRRPPG